MTTILAMMSSTHSHHHKSNDTFASLHMEKKTLISTTNYLQFAEVVISNSLRKQYRVLCLIGICRGTNKVARETLQDQVI